MAEWPWFTAITVQVWALFQWLRCERQDLTFLGLEGSFWFHVVAVFKDLMLALASALTIFAFYELAELSVVQVELSFGQLSVLEQTADRASALAGHLTPAWWVSLFAAIGITALALAAPELWARLGVLGRPATAYLRAARGVQFFLFFLCSFTVLGTGPGVPQTQTRASLDFLRESYGVQRQRLDVALQREFVDRLVQEGRKHLPRDFASVIEAQRRDQREAQELNRQIRESRSLGRPGASSDVPQEVPVAPGRADLERQMAAPRGSPYTAHAFVPPDFLRPSDVERIAAAVDAFERDTRNQRGLALRETGPRLSAELLADLLLSRRPLDGPWGRGEMLVFRPFVEELRRIANPFLPREVKAAGESIVRSGALDPAEFSRLAKAEVVDRVSRFVAGPEFAFGASLGEDARKIRERRAAAIASTRSAFSTWLSKAAGWQRDRLAKGVRMELARQLARSGYERLPSQYSRLSAEQSRLWQRVAAHNDRLGSIGLSNSERTSLRIEAPPRPQPSRVEPKGDFERGGLDFESVRMLSREVKSYVDEIESREGLRLVEGGAHLTPRALGAVFSGVAAGLETWLTGELAILRPFLAAWADASSDWVVQESEKFASGVLDSVAERGEGGLEGLDERIAESSKERGRRSPAFTSGVLRAARRIHDQQRERLASAERSLELEREAIARAAEEKRKRDAEATRRAEIARQRAARIARVKVALRRPEVERAVAKLFEESLRPAAARIHEGPTSFDMRMKLKELSIPTPSFYGDATLRYPAWASDVFEDAADRLVRPKTPAEKDAETLMREIERIENPHVAITNLERLAEAIASVGSEASVSQQLKHVRWELEGFALEDSETLGRHYGRHYVRSRAEEAASRRRLEADLRRARTQNRIRAQRMRARGRN